MGYAGHLVAASTLAWRFAVPPCPAGQCQHGDVASRANAGSFSTLRTSSSAPIKTIGALRMTRGQGVGVWPKCSFFPWLRLWVVVQFEVVAASLPRQMAA